MTPRVDVVCFLDRDHVLDLATHILRGPSEESTRALSDFFRPEPVDVAALLSEPRAEGVQFVMAPATYGDVATPPPETSVLVVRRSAVTAEVMQVLPHLHHVQKLGERSEGIDLGWAGAHDVSVELVPRPSLESTADHAVMLMLALLRKTLDGDRRARTLAAQTANDDHAVSYNWTDMRGLRTLHGSTVGLFGLGEVGTKVAKRVRAFGADVVYTSRTRVPVHREEQLGVRWLAPSELLSCSDIVSLHVPGTRANHGLVDEQFLRGMKAGAFLVNVARGSLVNEEALLTALHRGTLRGAGLDVHTYEPRRAADPLIGRDDVILSPHIAGGLRSDVIPEILGIVRGVRGAIDSHRVTEAAP